MSQMKEDSEKIQLMNVLTSKNFKNVLDMTFITYHSFILQLTWKANCLRLILLLLYQCSLFTSKLTETITLTLDNTGMQYVSS